MAPAKVSACIVTWNGKRLLERLLESLKTVQWPSLHIVVVDNAGTDGTAEMILERYPDIELVRLDRNIGYSAGINVGIEKTLSQAPDFVWVFNNDVVVEPDCLKKLVAVMESDPTIGVAGPIVFDYMTHKIAHAGYRINLWTGRMKEFGEPAGNEPYEVDSAFGCSNLIRKTVFDRIGGFDPGYNVYFDETDFNMRARRAGSKVVVVPAAKVYHEESATMNKFIARKAWLLLSNLVRFEFKNSSLAQLAVFIPYFLLLHIPLFLIQGAWYVFKLRDRERGK